MVYSELRRLFLTFRDKNSSSNMKIDTLSFLNTILIHHQPAVFLPHIKILVPVRVLDQCVQPMVITKPVWCFILVCYWFALTDLSLHYLVVKLL